MTIYIYSPYQAKFNKFNSRCSRVVNRFRPYDINRAVQMSIQNLILKQNKTILKYKPFDRSDGPQSLIACSHDCTRSDSRKHYSTVFACCLAHPINQPTLSIRSHSVGFTREEDKNGGDFCSPIRTMHHLPRLEPRSIQ
jgi:hypothetical protein